MYARTYKLFPFSKRNIKVLMDYSDKLYELSEVAEQHGDYEKSMELMSKGAEIVSLCGGGLHGYEDINCVWLTGHDLALAKKVMAMA